MRSMIKFLAISLSLSSLPGVIAISHAANVIGGTGLGFGDNTSQWVGTIQFNKDDLLKSWTTNVSSGQNITPSQQKDSGINVTVPQTGSMAWCDPAANPSIQGNTDITQCYGSAMDSKWFVLDFNEMQKKGVKTVYLKMSAKTFDDGDNDSTDDDLVPALTVFQGRQDLGGSLGWYPNQFQSNPTFWAWKLSPFIIDSTTKNGTSWSTAYDAPNKAVVTGKLTLKAGGQNYLTVAIGGDARHDNLVDKHAANFQLGVKVAKKAIPAICNITPTAQFDACGCETGTQWHPQMNHCMAINLCEAPQYLGECKTPQMCLDDCGR